MNKDRFSALVLLAVSILYLIGCRKLAFGSLSKPGPGFLPSILGLSLMFCTGIHLFTAFAKSGLHRNRSEQSERPDFRRLLILGGCAFLFPALLDSLNFILATFVSMFSMLLVLKPRSWRYSLVLALGLALGSFIVFAILLGVAVPLGFIEEWIYKIRSG